MTSPYGTIETLEVGRYVLRYERYEASMRPIS
jgi:hypothetical protein